jgi:hypothetical protein
MSIANRSQENLGASPSMAALFKTDDAPAKLKEDALDQSIMDRIRVLVTSSDLTKLTKKEIRKDLAEYFGVDLEHKRGYINQCIEAALLEQNL